MKIRLDGECRRMGGGWESRFVSCLFLLAVYLVPFPVLAQVKTTVTDNLVGPDGSPANGTMTITATGSFQSAGGHNVAQGWRIQVPVSDGSFTVNLIPNQGATPSGQNDSYTVIYNLTSSLGTSYWSETWFVPSTGPVGLAAVRTLPSLPANFLSPQSPNAVLAGPATGASGAPSFRALVGADLPSPSAATLGGVESLTCSNGQFLNQISTSGVPGCGTPSAGGDSGSVTSVGLSLPSLFDVTGSPVTGSGTLTATLASQAANQFFASPNGSAGAPGFRAITASDIPTLNQNTTGNAATTTALAATPSQCSGSQFAIGISANGDADCATPTLSNISFSSIQSGVNTNALQVGGGGVLAPAIGGEILATSYGNMVNAQTYYASGSTVSTTTVGSTPAGSTTVDFASTSSFMPNEGILIPGAGAVAAVGGTISYSSGLIATGTGVCVLTPTNGGGADALATIAVTSGTPATTLVIASPGQGYTSVPTSWTAALGSATACSGTVTTTAGTLIAGNYLGTITSFAGTVATVTPATATAVSAGTAINHDDTAAIQSAINAVGAAGGGTVFFPHGTYQVNGPWTNTSTANDILQIPDNGPLGADAEISIYLRGEEQPAWNYACCTAGGINAATGSIIETKAAAGNLLGAYCSNCGWQGSGTYPFTMVRVGLADLIFTAPSNPSITMINGQNFSQLDTEHVDIGIVQSGTATPQPVFQNGVGLQTPQENNQAYSNIFDTLVTGYYYGILVGEHTYLDQVGVFEDWVGLGIYGEPLHPITADRLLVVDCPYGLEATSTAGSNAHLHIDELDLENITASGTPAWASLVDDIYDPSSVLTGNFNYLKVGSGGPATTLTVSGAGELTYTDLNTGLTTVPSSASGILVTGSAAYTATGNTAAWPFYFINKYSSSGIGSVVAYQCPNWSGGCQLGVGSSPSNNNFGFLTMKSYGSGSSKNTLSLNIYNGTGALNLSASGGISNGISTTTNTDNRGHITLSSGTGTYTFTEGPGTGGIWTTAPICVIGDDTTPGNIATAAKSVTASTLTITNSAGASDTYSYICWPGN